MDGSPLIERSVAASGYALKGEGGGGLRDLALPGPPGLSLDPRNSPRTQCEVGGREGPGYGEG